MQLKVGSTGKHMLHAARNRTVEWCWQSSGREKNVTTLYCTNISLNLLDFTKPPCIIHILPVISMFFLSCNKKYILVKLHIAKIYSSALVCNQRMAPQPQLLLYIVRRYLVVKHGHAGFDMILYRMLLATNSKIWLPSY
jgi:hypothetical protein